MEGKRDGQNEKEVCVMFSFFNRHMFRYVGSLNTICFQGG